MGLTSPRFILSGTGKVIILVKAKLQNFLQFCKSSHICHKLSSKKVPKLKLLKR